MAVNPEFDQIVNLQPRTQDPEAAPAAPPYSNAPGTYLEPAQLAETPPPAMAGPVAQPVQATARKRSGWMVPAAIAAMGIIASGALGYLLYTTTGQRDSARHQLADTKATLATTQGTLATSEADLAAARSDAAAKQSIADYTRMFISNGGAVQIDYEKLAACNSFSQCRTSSQQLLTDLQAFQTARSGVQVPAALSSSDAALGDSVSAAIAGTQEFISGLDNANVAKITDGGKKVDAAMLGVAKAESALGTALK
jgi:hypothetical protein